MKKKYTIILFFGLLLHIFLIPDLFATHLMGSDITWTCVGKDSFLIKVVIYRDCNGVPLGSASIPIKCVTTGVSVTNVAISLPPPIDITPTCDSSCTRCQNRNCSFPYGIEQYTYTKLAVLSGADSCCKVSMSYTMCCRNGTITTGAAYSNFYIEATLDRCLNPCDNSPSFTSPPIAVICLGQDFQFNLGVIDLDVDSNGGLTDSISYEWTPPLGAVGSALSYTSPYTYDNPIYYYGFPDQNLPDSMGFHLDSKTGDISFRPMKVEQTVIALKVSEWREFNGVMAKIGETSRDMQIIVISCPSNSNPIIIGQFYKKVFAGDTVNFSITTDDLDPGDSLTLSCTHQIPLANWFAKTQANNHPTGSFKWKTEKSNVSSIPYVFYVTVKDNACPMYGFYCKAFHILVRDSNTLGFKEKVEREMIKVYPNPSTDQIIIESTDNELNLDRVVLTNVFGVKIREIPAKGTKSLIIERGNLPAGLYFLKITGSNSITYKSQILFL